MEFFKTNSRGIALCLAIAVPAWILGTFFPIVGGPVIAILLGMLIDLPNRQGELFQRVWRGHAPGRCDGAAAVRSERKLI